MPIDYDRFYQLPDSKVKKLMEIAKMVKEHKMETEGLGAIAMLFGKK